uniref:Uncharacterized protein n=1 Tax=Glossina pallidipes TaxID=7398 RepID=A0A1A9Z9H3_GLOPL
MKTTIKTDLGKLQDNTTAPWHDDIQFNLKQRSNREYIKCLSSSLRRGIMTSCLKIKEASLRDMQQICSNTDEQQPGDSQLSANDSKILANFVYDLTLHYRQTNYMYSVLKAELWRSKKPIQYFLKISWSASNRAQHDSPLFVPH